MTDTLEQRAEAFAALGKNDGGVVDDMLVEFAGSELKPLRELLQQAPVFCSESGQFVRESDDEHCGGCDGCLWWASVRDALREA